MEPIRDQRLGVEDVAPYSLPNGHGQVHKQTYPCDFDASVVFVVRGQVRRIVGVAMAV